MGQTCNGLQNNNINIQTVKRFNNQAATGMTQDQTGIPFEQIDSNQSNPLTQSKLLQSKTSNIRRRNDNLSQMVKSKLSQLPDMSVLKRNFDSDQRIYIDSLKAHFCGQCEGHRPSGFGALQFDNGDYLEGEFVDGRCESRGRYIRSNGSYYEGDLRNNIADGYGKYFDKTGYKYEGQWKNNMPNGRGEAVYPDESRYNGQFLNNRRHGKGVLMQNGCIFQGNFVQNKFQGEGTMQNQKGEKYKGGWKRNQKHGDGQYTWENGNHYKGAYKFGKRQGYGTMHYVNGEIYEGYWLNGLKHGDGSYRTAKKTIYGVWKNGQIIEQKQK